MPEICGTAEKMITNGAPTVLVLGYDGAALNAPAGSSLAPRHPRPTATRRDEGEADGRCTDARRAIARPDGRRGSRPRRADLRRGPSSSICVAGVGAFVLTVEGEILRMCYWTRRGGTR